MDSVSILRALPAFRSKCQSESGLLLSGSESAPVSIWLAGNTLPKSVSQSWTVIETHLIHHSVSAGKQHESVAKINDAHMQRHFPQFPLDIITSMLKLGSL